jgi:hypothetical protein
MKSKKKSATAKTVNTDTPAANTTGITIDTDIPVPSVRPHSKYPWQSLEVGHSFFAPINQKGGSAVAYGASKRYGKHFIGRKETKDGVDGVRFFHVAEPMRSRSLIVK